MRSTSCWSGHENSSIRQSRLRTTLIFRSICVIGSLLSGCQTISAREAGSAQETIAAAGATLPGTADRGGCVVGGVPQAYSFDPFYEKYCDADGIPILSSTDVGDPALKQAYDVIMNMLEPIPEVRRELISNGAYFGIIGKKESLTDLPEYAQLENGRRGDRLRGLGGSKNFPITSSAEENLLCLTWDRYYGESITVHEFAHTISLMGLGDHFEPLLAEFTLLYESAARQGLWINTYAGSDIQEYWAEGVQSYFNANLESQPPDGIHNHVDTREELADYDPALYDFISRFFRDFEWTPACPE